MQKQKIRILDSPFPILLALRLPVMLCMIGTGLSINDDHRILTLMAMVFILFSTIALYKLKRGHWILLLLELSLCLGLAVEYMYTDFPYPLLIGLLGTCFFLHYDHKWIYIGWTFLFIALISIELALSLHSSLTLVIDYSFVVFACLVGSLLRYAYQMKNRFQSLYQELEVSYQKLQEHTQTVEQLTKEKERNRIAQEIHDTVGHTVTALIFQLEAAHKYWQKEPQKSKELLQTAEGLARSIYQEIRLSIETDEQGNWGKLEIDQLWKGLLEEFSLLTQLDYSFQMMGEPPNLTRTEKFELYRILQESLTNAKRHGQASKVWVQCDFRHSPVQMEIRDDGIGAPSLKLGYGLKNMQERVENLGGSCHFETSEGKGFRTVLLLPLKEADDGSNRDSG